MVMKCGKVKRKQIGKKNLGYFKLNCNYVKKKNEDKVVCEYYLVDLKENG